MIQSNVLQENDVKPVMNLNNNNNVNGSAGNGNNVRGNSHGELDMLGDIFDSDDNTKDNNSNNAPKDDFDDFFGDTITKNVSPVKNKPNIQPKFTVVPYKNCITPEQFSAKQNLNNVSID